MQRSILQRLLGLMRTPGNQTPSGTPRSSAHCASCGADWGAGRWSEGCEECGGGGLSRNCPICQGRCGTTVRRAVIDSNDERCAHWIGACGLAPMTSAPRTGPAPVSRYLFCFGYQTPHQLRIMARNPEWDEQDSTSILIDADSEDEASRLGFAYADAFVRQLFEHEDRWLKDPPYVWSIQPYAHWFEADPREIASAEAGGVETIASAGDIAALFPTAPAK